LPRSGNSVGLRIIQYFDSSAGMVQPTRIVCCAYDELTPASTAAIAPAAKTHFEGIRIIPTPLFRCQQAPAQKLLASNLSWFKQSGKPPELARNRPARGGMCGKARVPDRDLPAANLGEVQWRALAEQTDKAGKGSAISGSE
jgi:hypothetical protein